jgi:mono/diheme cytochrome c family protein
MRLSRVIALGFGLVMLVACGLSLAATSQDSDNGRRGWTIPEGASKEANPVATSPPVVEQGKKIYEKNCRRCHGDSGQGNGPDADPDEPPEDLTDPARAARNPDGVMFHKVWNGRKSPKMPAFKSEGLSKEDVWTVIHYVKTLRKS